MKKESGITLVALVITIIVLVILVGISINVSVGQNGILNQAQNSVTSTKSGTATEQVIAAWGNGHADYLASGTGKEKSTYFTIDKLNENLSIGEIIDVDHGINATDDNEVIYKVTEGEIDTYYKMQVSADGAVSILEGPTKTEPTYVSALANQIDTSNYGDYVNYEIDLGITTAEEVEKLGDGEVPKTDWRIFYKNEETVFLIASDYIPVSKFPAGVFGNNNGIFSGYWVKDTENTSKLTTSGKVTNNNSFLFTKLSNVSKTNLNYQAVSTLLDASKWSDLAKPEYVYKTSTAVIGSPTVEMWMASWNEKYEGETLSFDANDRGYQVGVDANSLGNSLQASVMKDKEGYLDTTLYYPRRENVNDCNGYWLATPSSFSVNYLYTVMNNSAIARPPLTTQYFGVRPVVSLKSGIKATQDENDVWQLEE